MVRYSRRSASFLGFDLDCRSAIEIDTRNPEHPKLNLEVVIDGKIAYKWVLLSSFKCSGILTDSIS
jgi:hypothetical protein